MIFSRFFAAAKVRLDCNLIKSWAISSRIELHGIILVYLLRSYQMDVKSII